MSKFFLTFVMALIVVMIGCYNEKKANTEPEATAVTDTVTDTIAVDTQTVAATNSAADVVDSSETVTIGGKTWTRRNLNIETAGSWCYENNTWMCNVHGRLYTWDAAVRVCKTLGDGWRLPNDNDWNALFEAGGKMIISSSKFNMKGTDSFGGMRNLHGEFHSFDHHAFWWNGTEANSKHAFGRSMVYGFEDWLSKQTEADKRGSDKRMGYSVRCIRDDR